jgi:hypothetical protein
MNTLKNLCILALIVLWTLGNSAQAQTGINYQGLARRASGAPVAEQNIKLKLSIRDVSVSGTVVYTETRSTATNKFGLFNVVIGSSGAASQTSTLAGVNWATGAKFLQVELDPDGGNNFVDMGTTQLQAVPYALYANDVAKLQGKALSTTAPTANQILKYNGTAWAPANEAAGSSITVGAVAATATPNAASITSGVLNLAPADATNAGIVTTAAQSFAGAKTFTNDLVINSVKIGRGIGNNDQNTAIGNGALGTGTGTRNTAVGYAALLNYSGTSFDNNTSVGYYNFPSLTTGQQNTSIGAEAMLHLTTGNHNTAIGAQTLLNTTGNNNTAIGYRAGETLAAGSSNTLLGHGANVGSPTSDNATAIGAFATVTTDNTIQLGNTGITDVKTSGKLTTGAITYPNTAGTNGQVLTTNGNGTATWTTPSASGASAVPKFVRSFTQTYNNSVVNCVAQSEVSIGNLTFSIQPVADGNGIAVNGGGSNLVVKSSTPGDYQFISNLGNGNTDQRLFSVTSTNQNVSNLLLNSYSTLTSTIFNYYSDGTDSYEVKASMDGGMSVLLVVTYYKL